MTFDSKWQRNFGLVMFYEEERHQYMLSSLKLVYDPSLENLPMNIIINEFELNYSAFQEQITSCDEFNYAIVGKANDDNSHCIHVKICDMAFIFTQEQIALLNTIPNIEDY